MWHCKDPHKKAIGSIMCGLRCLILKESFFLKHKDFPALVLFPILPYRVGAWKVVEKKSCRIWHKSFKVKRLLTQFGNRQFQEWKSMLLASTLESATFIAIFSDFPKINQVCTIRIGSHLRMCGWSNSNYAELGEWGRREKYICFLKEVITDIESESDIKLSTMHWT